MSIHVCKCEHNGRTEYHLRYPGLTQQDAQALADNINSGQLVGADHPLRKDAERYRKLRNASMDERNRLEHYAGWALDEALDALPAVRAA